MGICPVCNQPMHDNPKDWIEHHYHWPKKKWHGKVVLIEVHVKCERAYHAYYSGLCAHWDRNCSRCLYRRICCHNNTPRR